MDRRIINIACVLIGMVAVIVSLRLLLDNQYTILHRKILTDEPVRVVSTFVPLFGGIWAFLFGLVGLIDEKRRKRTKSE